MIANTNFRGHIWADLEPDFQLILAEQRGFSCCPVLVAESQLRIMQRATESAIQIFRKWRFAAANEEGEDAASEWLLKMHEGIYASCDMDRPVHPYAYCALRNICMAQSRKAKSFKQLSNEQVIEDLAQPPMTRAIKSEQISMLAIAVEGMPFLEQAAMRWLLSIFHVSDSFDYPAMKNYSAAYRAKKKLIDRFRDYRNLDN